MDMSSSSDARANGYPAGRQVSLSALIVADVAKWSRAVKLSGARLD